MGVDLFPTGNQVVKPTTLRQGVHRTIGTPTGTDESLEPVNNHSTMQTNPPKPENNQSTTYVVPRGKRVIKTPKISNHLLEVRFASCKKKQRRL